MADADWNSPSTRLSLHRLGLFNARNALASQVADSTASGYELLEANRNAILALIALGDRLAEQMQGQLVTAAPRAPRPIPADAELASAAADWDVVRRRL